MKTKISILTIIYTLGVSVSAFAAPSVRTLGGANTYSSAASASGGSTSAGTTAPKASDGAGESLRGGAMRVDSGSTIGSVRASSSRAASTPRLSIGKYLTTSQTVSGGANGGSGVRPPQQSGGIPDADLEDIRQEMAALQSQITQIQKDFSEIVGKEYEFSYDDETGLLVVKEDDAVVLEARMVTFDDLQALEDKLNNLIAKHNADVEAIYNEIDTKQDILTAGKGITIDANNVISATGGNVTEARIEALEGAIDSKQDALVAGDAISISDSNVISVKVGSGLAVDKTTNTLNVTVKEGTDYQGGTGITVDNAAHTIALALKGGDGIKVDGATVSMDTPSGSGNYFYAVSGTGAAEWMPFEVVDASALPSDTTVSEVTQE